MEMTGIPHYERLSRLLDRAENDDEARIVHIRPDTAQYGLLDYHKADEIILVRGGDLSMVEAFVEALFEALLFGA